MKKIFFLFLVAFLCFAAGCNPQSEPKKEETQSTQTATEAKIEIDFTKPEYGAGIIRVYNQDIPKTRFIGKKYYHPTDWGEAWANKWFGKIEEAAGGESKIHELYEDAGAYVGLYLFDKNENTGDDILREYWVGMFTPAGTTAPEGLEYVDFDAGKLGVCWIYGYLPEMKNVYGQCIQTVTDAGMEIKYNSDGSYWVMERDTCPRFTDPDEKGYVIRDYCYFVK